MTPHEPSFEIGSSIPVLRMFDEAEAKAFYCDFLGFEVEWEHRFREGAPLYAQVRLGKAVLHLNGHAQPDAPVTEVRIPVRGIDDFCASLKGRRPEHTDPQLVDPRGTGRGTDINLHDPFGNVVVFWREA